MDTSKMPRYVLEDNVFNSLVENRLELIKSITPSVFFVDNSGNPLVTYEYWNTGEKGLDLKNIDFLINQRLEYLKSQYEKVTLAG